MTIFTKAATAMHVCKDQARRDCCSLSSGERVRVRASVLLTCLFPDNPRPRVSRQRVWCTFLQRVENHVAHVLPLAPQLSVPEPKFLDTHRSEELSPFGVAGLLVRETVLPPVEFNRKTCLAAVEIEEVISDREIAPKLIGAKTPVAQPTPHQLFSPSLLLAQSAGAFGVGHGKSLNSRRSFRKNGLTTALTPARSPRRGRTVRRPSSYPARLDCSKASLCSSSAEPGGAA